MAKVLTIQYIVLILGLAAVATCYKRAGAAKPSLGNGCPESSPWPCKTPGTCLSFDFICDGEADCPDSYDEDPALCIAKDRPPEVLLVNFIENWRDWLVPNILGDKSIKVLARELIESKTIEDYSKNVGLNPTQFKNLKSVMEAIRTGRQIDLLLMGMPERAWNDIYALFSRIVKSGFIGKENVY